jgi:translation initiation factor 2B subunit (eIF-2B alpha/beta/delta family)
LRAEIQKHGTAIQEANKRKASVQEACRLFKSYLSAETKFVNSLEENSQACGVPAEAIKQVREGHAKAGQIGKQVCDATARGPRGYEDCNVCGKMGDWGPLVR